MSGIALAVHGGAGSIEPNEPDAQAMRQALAACLEQGRACLAGGGSALDSVERIVRSFEAHPLFNAGRGSVLTAEGTVEMDAAIMDGRSRAAGSVACVRRLAHPVSAARAVMERSRHVLLVGDQAERFARALGAEEVEPASLVTEKRLRQLEQAREKERVSLDHDEHSRRGDRGESGTVGAVARDAAGHLAAATSTGGLTNQLPGRAGDTAVIGAGTWADDATCAVSATGHGEAFIRAALAHEVDAGLRLAGLALEEACERALARVTALGSRGGLVAVDAEGRVAAPFTTRGMVRGWIGAEGAPRVSLFADE
jgi:isoaspartyl peptidase/L-asparaginase-like protein (Ntn-hydrolase superfamily)